MLFKKEFLRELAYDGGNDSAIVIEDKIVGQRRWSTDHRLVFKFEDKFYKTTYSCGSTECQDESPYEYEDDEIECPEVVPVEIPTIEYRQAGEE